MTKKLHSVVVYFQAQDDFPAHIEGKVLANICECCGSLFFGEKERHYRELHPKVILKIDNPTTGKHTMLTVPGDTVCQKCGLGWDSEVHRD